LSNNYDRLIALTQKLDDKLMQKDNISSSNNKVPDTETSNIDSLDRENNIQRLRMLFEELGINKKCSCLEAKNISLGYFGNGANLSPELKNNIIDFVLRWRYEKGFQSQDHYKLLINKIII